VIELPLIDNKNILTKTGGFLGAGFTHTINIAEGCPYAGSICGIYCYARHNAWITKGRPWGLYGFKENAREPYRRQYDALKRPRRGDPKPLRIFMCSSTDPYPPQKEGREVTRSLLEEMRDRPPDALVLQTRGPFVVDDLDLIAELSSHFELWVSITVETDRERLPAPFPNHATPIKKRIAALKAFRERGVLTQATVSPLLPLVDPERFAEKLGKVSDRIILDHYLLGDGSPGGLRTKRTDFPERLEASGFGEWKELEKFWEVKATFDRVLGPERVLVSADGFNAIGGAATTPAPAAVQETPAPATPRRRPEETKDGAAAPRDKDLAAFLARLPEARSTLEARARQLRNDVRGVVKGYSTGLYLFGPAGHGKTHAVVETLTSMKAAFEHHQGQVTPGGLIDALGERPDAIHVFDDVTDILKHKVALQVLLGALGRPAGRSPSDPGAHLRRIKYKRQGAEHVIEFTGGVIALSNLPLPDNEVAGAFASRVDVIHYRLSDEEAAALMLEIAKRGFRDQQGRELSAAAALEVAHFVIGEALRAGGPFDLRDLTHKGLPKRLQYEQGDMEGHWQDAVRAALRQRFTAAPGEVRLPDSPRLLSGERLTEIAAEIAAVNGRGEEARVKEWEDRTGKAERTFYRYLERARRQG
jgi:DNA repair photolyase